MSHLCLVTVAGFKAPVVCSLHFPVAAFCLLNSPPSAERQWAESSPKSTLTLLGNSRPSESPLGPHEFCSSGKNSPGLPCFQSSELQASFHSHELSMSESQEAMPPAGSQAFLAFNTVTTVTSGLPPSEDAGTLLVNSHGPSPVPGTSLTTTGAADNGFLSHNFLTVSPGASSHHSPGLQNQGISLPGQPPLPEKKRTSEGDRSLGSVSPSSSGFSSPHSGSTMSIPFPNVLPDFCKPSEVATPLPGMSLCLPVPSGEVGWGFPFEPAFYAKSSVLQEMFRPPVASFPSCLPKARQGQFFL